MVAATMDDLATNVKPTNDYLYLSGVEIMNVARSAGSELPSWCVRISDISAFAIGKLALG